MKYIHLVLNWVFGVLFALAGLMVVVASHPLPSIPLILISLLLLPPIRNFAFEKTGRSLTVTQRRFSICVLLVAFPILLSIGEYRRTRRLEEQQAQEQAEREAALRKKKIEHFRSNKAVLLAEFQTEYDKGNYQQVLYKASKFLVSNDPDLIEVHKLAKSKLDEIARKEKEERILAELKGIPASNLEKNRDLYRQLLSLYPDNAKYKTKYDYYASRIINKKRELAKNVQGGLNTLGIHTGPIDGVCGPQTKSAIQKFQKEHDLPIDGEVSESLLEHLHKALHSRSKLAKTKKSHKVTRRFCMVGDICTISNTGLESAIATSKRSWERFGTALVEDDKLLVLQMMAREELIAVEEGTKVKFLAYTRWFSNVAKIRILTGEYAGRLGYTLSSNLSPQD